MVQYGNRAVALMDAAGIPATVAVTVFAPAPDPSVQAGSVTVPSDPETALEPARVPLPAVTENETGIPDNGALSPLVTRRTTAEDTAVLIRAVWAFPETSAIAVGFAGSIFGVGGCDGPASPLHPIRNAARSDDSPV